MESCRDNVVFTMLPSSKDLILLCSMTLKYMHINLWIWVHLKVDFSLCEDWFIVCSTFREVWNVVVTCISTTWWTLNSSFLLL